MEKDLYKILGIDRNADDKTIKKAFKKLAIKYHPDRQTDKSEEEKKEAEEKFKEINGAYQILSDPQKKQQYDTFGTVDQNAFNSGGFGSFDDIMSMFGDHFGAFSGFSKFAGMHRNSGEAYRRASKGQSIRIQVPLTLEEVYTGCTKKFKYKINKLDKDKEVTVCPHCHGTGYITRVTQSMGFMQQVSSPCPHCGGLGKTAHFHSEEKTIELNIVAGVQHGENEIKYEQGSDSIDGGPAGDLIIIYVYNFDTNKYGIVDHDVYESVEIPYYDCLLGEEIEHELPNKEKVKVTIPECVKENTKLRIRNKGINSNGYAGNYYLIINYKYPEKLSDKEKEILKQIKDNQ